MIQAIRGAKDIYGDEARLFRKAENVFVKVSSSFGYEEFRAPIIEPAETFTGSIGESSDIVNKEMYIFQDKGGEYIALRPEMTAEAVRAIVQNKILGQNPLYRCWYFGPFFRYERPQKGRQRQFHQYGAECVGANSAESDVEIIQLATAILKNLGICDYKLLLNTLGSADSRAKYRDALIEYLNSKKETLSRDSLTRMDVNPLRVLDSKDEQDKIALDGAPSILDYLDSESAERYAAVKDHLDKIGIEYEETPRLVRGLDYYSHTVFELQAKGLGSQDSVGGGGRYNNLFERFGAQQTNCVGFAMGVERLLIAMQNSENFSNDFSKTDLYVVYNEALNYPVAAKIANIARECGLNASTDILRKSFKAQFREADKLGAKFVAIIGDDEIANNSISFKNFASKEQISIPIDNLKDYLEKL